jgi:hypothetical protein
MKLIKIAYAAVAATFALGLSAVAQGSPALNSIVPVSFSLTVQVEARSTYNPTNKTYTYKYTTVKLANRDILAILADIANTNWPSGAQLGFGDNTLLVLDKNGNVLYNADRENDNGYIRFEPSYFGIGASVKGVKTLGINREGGVYSGTYTTSPYAINDYFATQGYLEIYDDGDQYYIDMSGGGLTQGIVNYDSSKNKGSEAIFFLPVLSGGFDESSAIATGTVIAGGKITNIRN